MDQKIVDILKEVLEDENVNAEASQSNCASWDSMHHLNLVVELEDAFNVSFEPEEIAEMKSVVVIKALLESKGVSF